MIKKLGLNISFCLLIFVGSVAIFDLFLLLLGIKNSISSVGYTVKILAAYVLTLVLLLKMFKRPKKLDFKIKKTNLFIFLSIGMLSIWVNGLIVFIFYKISEGLNINFLDSQPTYYKGMLYFILLFLNVVIIPSIFQEIIFRGVILELLRPYGSVFSIVVSSVFEGLCCTNVFKITVTFFLGLFLAFLKLKSASLIPGILIHALNNLFLELKSVLDVLEIKNYLIVFYTVLTVFVVIIGFFGIFNLIKNEYFKQKIKFSILKNFLTIFFSWGAICFVINCFVSSWVSLKFMQNTQTQARELDTFEIQDTEDENVVMVKGGRWSI